MLKQAVNGKKVGRKPSNVGVLDAAKSTNYFYDDRPFPPCNNDVVPTKGGPPLSEQPRMPLQTP